MRPYIEPGDMIIVKDKKANEIEEGEVITYRNSSNLLVTHRVVDKLSSNEKYTFKTKGDANNIPDGSVVTSDRIIGVEAFKIPYVGYVSNFIKSKKGFYLAFIIPILIVLVGQFKATLLKVNWKK